MTRLLLLAHRLWLFVRIVWRDCSYDYRRKFYMPVRLAWEVSKTMWP